MLLEGGRRSRDCFPAKGHGGRVWVGGGGEDSWVSGSARPCLLELSYPHKNSSTLGPVSCRSPAELS